MRFCSTTKELTEMKNSMEVPMELNTPSKNRTTTTTDTGTLTATPTASSAVTTSPSIGHPENSPVFNYINNLSPIVPVRYTSITHCTSNSQTLNTIFSSPQPNAHVVARSFLGRSQSLDQGESTAKAIDTTKASEPLSGSHDDTELSPDSNRSSVIGRDFDVEMEEKSDKGFVLSKRKERLDTSDYNWDDLTFDTPLVVGNCEEEKSIDEGIFSSFISEVLQTPENHAQGSVITEFTGAAYSPFGRNMGESGSQSNTFEGQMKGDQLPDILSGSVLQLVDGEATVEVDGGLEIGSQSQSKQNSARRRCLLYEMPGAHKRKAQCNPISSSPVEMKSGYKVIDVETCTLEANKLSKISEKGVGLHLNAIATTLNDGEAVKIKNLSTEKKGTREDLVHCGSNSKVKQIASQQLTYIGGDSGDTSPRAKRQKLELIRNVSNNKVIQIAPQQLTDVGGDSVNTSPRAQRQKLEPVRCSSNNKVIQIAPQELTDVGGDSGDSSPRAKRQKLEPGTSCKRCNCKRSKCLKLYCECFAAGLYCIEPCSCQDCFNKPAHEDVVVETRRQIESRCPLAFAPKVINTADTESGDEMSKTPASARHKKGCNCKRSSCLKKYCECFQGGVGCSPFCRCEGCRNTFGRRLGVEMNELEGEELKADKKTESDATLNNDIIEKEEQRPNLLTPFENSRFPIQPKITTTGQLSGSSLPADNPHQIHTSVRPILRRQALHERVNLVTIPENEASDTTNNKCSTSKQKENFASSNSSRISSHLAPGKLSRRLILRSVPPFPSLNIQGDTHP